MNLKECKNNVLIKNILLEKTIVIVFKISIFWASLRPVFILMDVEFSFPLLKIYKYWVFLSFPRLIVKNEYFLSGTESTFMNGIYCYFWCVLEIGSDGFADLAAQGAFFGINYFVNNDLISSNLSFPKGILGKSFIIQVKIGL